MAEFKTHSMAGAAYAVANGKRIVRCDRVDERRCVFVFDEPVAALVQEYFRGGEVPATLFFDAIIELRTQVNRALRGAR